jgi:hypothetical protein
MLVHLTSQVDLASMEQVLEQSNEQLVKIKQMLKQQKSVRRNSITAPSLTIPSPLLKMKEIPIEEPALPSRSPGMLTPKSSASKLMRMFGVQVLCVSRRPSLPRVCKRFEVLARRRHSRSNLR